MIKKYIKFKKIIICATVKNESKNLRLYFNILKKIIALSEDYFVILVESDSSDNTFELANKLIKNLKGIVLKINTNHFKLRTEKISLCRNAYLDYIKNNIKLSKYDLLFVTDVDKVNNNIKLNNIYNSIKNAPKNWVGLFANQKYSYYDVWALKINKIFNEDCYKKLIEMSKIYSPRKSYFLSIFKNFFILKKQRGRYISVTSAFGGLGIYKLHKVINSVYESNLGQNSEHVKFNENILKKNKNNSLYIDKLLINSSGINEHLLKGIIYTLSNYYSKKLIKKYIKISLHL